MSAAIYRLGEKLNILKFPKKEKFYVLSYIRAIANAGIDEKKGILNKYNEYVLRKQGYLTFKMEKAKRAIESGKKIAIAMEDAGIINQRELHILLTSKGGLVAGIDKILEVSRRSNKSKVALMLLLIPPTIITVALLVFHDSVKQIIVNMMKPLVSAGATPPPIPSYLNDPTLYINGNIAWFTLMIVFFGGMAFLKKYKPYRFMKVIPIIEEEYTIDILKSLQSVMEGGGINLSNAAKALANGETDSIRKGIFERIVARTGAGKEKLSDVFDEFGVNYNTISSIKIGEDSNDLSIGLNIALEDIEVRYNRDIKIFIQFGLWGGQLAMLGIALKPMIDIMMLMSVSQLNFSV